jgi:predicted esterase
MATGNPLIFKDAEAAKNAIMESQKKEIAALYEKWADEIGDRASYFAKKSTASSVVSEMQMKELQKMLKATGQEVSNEVYHKIKGNMYTIADAVVADNVKWLESFGFSKDGLNAAFNYVPDEVVRNLITGQIYDSGWSLSARIWGDNEQTMKDAYQIMAKGLAENKPVFEIAKELEQYVRPSAKLPWNPVLAMKNTKTGQIEYKRIYKKQVDYNAQRLARTLAQHSYQQSFIATTQKNPFITDYIWHSNGSRVCELCASRDGVHYKKDELPMDHPNGMCTMEPNVADDMIDQLADWFNSPDGTYPEIDDFASNFGYVVPKTSDIKTPMDFVNKYGMSTKSPNAWFNSLTQTQKAEAKMLKEQSGLTWNDWYEKNVHSTGNPNLDFAKKWGTSDKSPAAWFNSMSPQMKAEAKLLKEQSGLTWNQWYEKYVHTAGNAKAVAGKVATSSLDDALVIAQKKLGAIPNKTYSGIWVDDVTVADYESKIDSIVGKKEFYQHKLDGLNDPTSNVYQSFIKYGKNPDEYIKLYKKYLDDLDEFEALGKKYMKAQKEVKAAKLALHKAKGPAGKFDPTEYTDEAKAAAKSFTSRSAADKFHRQYLDEIWDEGTEYEKYSVWEYTQNSNPINKSLSGYHDGWSRSEFLGLGNTELGHEDRWRHFDTSEFDRKFGVDGHKDYKNVVKNLTTMLDKSELPESVYLVRGSDTNGLAGLLEGDLLSFDDARKLIRSGDSKAIKTALEGQTFTNHSFMSTGIAKDAGFDGNVKYEIFAPKGTHAIYAEPASYYGSTVGMKEELYKVGQSYSRVGGEAEVIIQRGTSFRITDVTADRYGDITIKMEVVDQPDYFKSGLEHTYNGGKTSYKK